MEKHSRVDSSNQRGDADASLSLPLATQDAPPTPVPNHHHRTTMIRLLVHAADGLIPYLTPRLLQTCFPAPNKTTSQGGGDRLWVGMAVKDTCVVPAFGTEADAKQNRHPRGYTFATSDTAVDAWMQPYTRITVPTFDMVADARERQQQLPNKTKDDVVVVATDQHVLLWTAHGRQNLTPTQYQSCAARALNSAWTVPLFDAGGSSSSGSSSGSGQSNNNKKKRWYAAVRRTQRWTAQHVAQQTSTNNTSGMLLPVLVHPQLVVQDTGIAQQVQHLLEKYKIGKDKHSGVVLIGWSDLPEQLQVSTLKQVKSRLPLTTPLAILETKSLAQIIQAASHGVTIIGSDLPRQWALQKRAFLLDWEDCWKEISSIDAEPSNKRPKVNGKTTHNSNDPQHRLDRNACLDLHSLEDRVANHPWYRDKQPILPQCTCHACQIHSRAYIYHLVCAKEMLAEVLLFIHNLHHMLRLVESMEKEVVDNPTRREALLSFIKALEENGGGAPTSS